MRETIKPYWPLIVVITLACFIPVAIMGQFHFMMWMHHAMGMFMVLLGMFKVFDINGFKKGFRKYDIVTEKLPIYGSLYPFIEIGLGFLYLTMTALLATYVATIVVMGVGLAGIIRSIRRGQKLNCTCMGNVLQVPLSTVSIVENGSMIVMSVLMILFY